MIVEPLNFDSFSFASIADVASFSFCFDCFLLTIQFSNFQQAYGYRQTNRPFRQELDAKLGNKLSAVSISCFSSLLSNKIKCFRLSFYRAVNKSVMIKCKDFPPDIQVSA